MNLALALLFGVVVPFGVAGAFGRGEPAAAFVVAGSFLLALYFLYRSGG